VRTRDLRRLGAAALLGLALASGAAAHPSSRESVPGLSDRPSHGGAYRAGVVERPGLHSWIVRVTDASGAPVRGATLAAETRRAESGAAVAERPRVSRHLGDGRYRIDGVRFPAAGWWSVALRVEAGGRADSLAFNQIVHP